MIYYEHNAFHLSRWDMAPGSYLAHSCSRGGPMINWGLSRVDPAFTHAAGTSSSNPPLVPLLPGNEKRVEMCQVFSLLSSPPVETVTLVPPHTWTPSLQCAFILMAAAAIQHLHLTLNSATQVWIRIVSSVYLQKAGSKNGHILCDPPKWISYVSVLYWPL